MYLKKLQSINFRYLLLLRFFSVLVPGAAEDRRQEIGEQAGKLHLLIQFLLHLRSSLKMISIGFFVKGREHEALEIRNVPPTYRVKNFTGAPQIL